MILQPSFTGQENSTQLLRLRLPSCSCILPRGFGYGTHKDRIAHAIHQHAPDRAVAFWKDRAEIHIARVKPSAYHFAAMYLRKAAAVMIREKKQKEWDGYLQQLREKHRRKRRLIEVLDGMESS